MKRHVLIPAAFFFVIAIFFSGCAVDTENDIVLMVQQEEVRRKEFEYQLISMMTAYEYYSGSPIDWSLPIDGMTASEFFKKQAANNAVLFRVVKYKGQEMGLALTEEELQQIDKNVEALIAQTGGEKEFNRQLEQQGLDRELYTIILQGPESYYKIFQALYGEGGELTPTEESVYEYYQQAYLRTQHIMKFLTDEEGNALDSQAIEERRAELEDVYSKIQNGEDFSALMLEHNEDVGINGAPISFSHGEMPEDYFQAAISLETGEVTEILSIDGTLVIINRLSLDDAFLTENYESIREEYATEAFNELLEEWKEDLDVEMTPLYNEIDPKAVYEAQKAKNIA